MVKRPKVNPKVRNLLLAGMGLGFLFILGGEFEESGSSFGNFIQGFSLTSLDVLSVDQDPVTGAVKGNVILGNADFSVSINTAPKKSSSCPSSVSGASILESGNSIHFGSGSSSGGCSLAMAEWDLSELPDDLSVTSIIMQMKHDPRKSIFGGFLQKSCKIGIIEQPYDTIAREQLIIRANNPDSLIVNGNWCHTSGLKTLILPQSALDAFDRALKGDDKWTISFTIDPWTKGTLCCWQLDPNLWGTEGSFIINGFADPVSCPVGEHQVGFKCEPLACDEGFEVNGNICSQIICPVGENLIGSICTPIECQVGERLVGNNCEEIICPVGTTLIGSDCDPIVCQEGFTLSGNECTSISCPTGSELVGSTCEEILCPLGNFLQGNDCVPIVCPTGNHLEGNNCVQIQCESDERLDGNICTPIQCQTGEQIVNGVCEIINCQTGTEMIGSECLEIVCTTSEELVGNDCIERTPVEQSEFLNCPAGTIESKNVCIQIIPQPQPLQISGAPPNILTILGIAIFLISFGGFVVRGVARKNF